MEASRRRSSSDRRREEILAAALAAFTKSGFARATMADVRRASGASIGSIYHHFAGKEQLAAALYADGLRRYQEGLVSELTAGDRAEAGVKAAVRHHLRWVAANRDLAAFMLGPREPEVLLASQAEVRRLNRRLFAEAGGWLRARAREGSLRDLPEDLLYTLLIGPSQEFCRHWLAGRIQTPIEEAVEVLAQAAWDALKGADEK